MWNLKEFRNNLCDWLQEEKILFVQDLCSLHNLLFSMFQQRFDKKNNVSYICNKWMRKHWEHIAIYEYGTIFSICSSPWFRRMIKMFQIFLSKLVTKVILYIVILKRLQKYVYKKNGSVISQPHTLTGIPCKSPNLNSIIITYITYYFILFYFKNVHCVCKRMVS